MLFLLTDMQNLKLILEYIHNMHCSIQEINTKIDSLKQLHISDREAIGESHVPPLDTPESHLAMAVLPINSADELQ